MPRSRAIRRTGTRVSCRSVIASGTVSQIPVTTSTVLRSNSLCTCGVSPISAITAAASLLRSRVSGSTRANSHSTPTVGRGDPAKSIRARLLRGEDTAGHPAAGITGGQRLLIRTGGAVDLLVLLGWNVAEVVGLLVDHDGGLGAREQILGRERVRRGDQLGRAVAANLQRAQVAT